MRAAARSCADPLNRGKPRRAAVLGPPRRKRKNGRMAPAKPLPAIAALLPLLLAAAPLRAASTPPQVTIYRCTDADGRVALRDTPCHAGSEQQVRNMLRPRDAPPAPTPAPAPERADAAPAAPAPTRVIVVREARPLYECTMPDGERYTSDTAEGNPRWVPLWTLGWPVQADGARDSLAITGGSVRIGDDAIALRRPLPQPAWPAGAGTWVRDSCHALPLAEACARLRERRDEINRQFFNAQANERDRLRPQRRSIGARLDADCA